jgi:hypothetical protein
MNDTMEHVSTDRTEIEHVFMRNLERQKKTGTFRAHVPNFMRHEPDEENESDQRSDASTQC